MIHTKYISELPLDLQHLVQRAAEVLKKEFEGTFGYETVERFIADSLDQLMPRARITTFVPILTERFARERLKALARIENSDQDYAPGVLFLCVHNAGRSQMAAGWLRHLAGDRVTVWSGGSDPTSEINPSVIEAMNEVGVDISTEFPKPWTDEIVRAADVVITMGCGDACPLYPGKRYEDWELPDPAGQGIAFVRPVRDEIKSRVEQLVSTLGLS